jgi:hypothetical protein
VRFAVPAMRSAARWTSLNVGVSVGDGSAGI